MHGSRHVALLFSSSLVSEQCGLPAALMQPLPSSGRGVVLQVCLILNSLMRVQSVELISFCSLIRPKSCWSAIIYVMLAGLWQQETYKYNNTFLFQSYSSLFVETTSSAVHVFHQNQNQKQIYHQEGFYTNEEFVLLDRVHALKTINNKQTVTIIYT